jgi:hypothetical protein
MDKVEKSLLDVLDDLSELLKVNHNFYEIIFKGEKTSVRISKPEKVEEIKEDEVKEIQK